jgi:hypothetical protein
MERRGRIPPVWVVPTSLFIRDRLAQVGEDYPYGMWRALKEARERFFREKGGRGGRARWRKDAFAGSYQNFRNYIYWLEKLGLIRFVREAPPPRRGLEARRFYALVKGREKDEGWRNPRRSLYPGSWKARPRRRREA